MDIRVIAVGRRMPVWVDAAWQEYHKRLPRSISLELIEVAPEGRKGLSAVQAMQGEASRIQAAQRDGAMAVVLDERGKHYRSVELAERLDDWAQQRVALDMIIGGADGLAPEIRQAARHTWALSNLTLPHAMVRVLLVEQIYRACSIIDGHPYHRE